MNKLLFKRATLLLIIIGILDLLAEVFYLHWTVWWYDNTLHFLAGGCVALAFLSLTYFFKPSGLLRTVFIGVLFSLIIGILWEFFELYIGATSFADGVAYIYDTISDILMDTTGGFFASLYAHDILLKTSSTNQ